MKNSKLLVVSGFSGSGKSSILKELLARHPDLELVKSYTTRTQRGPGDYYTFVSQEMFNQLKEQDAFLETNTYSGEWYGTPKAEVERIQSEGKLAIAEVDPNGFRQIAACGLWNHEMTKSVFIVADADTILSRLQNRKTDSREKILARMRTAIKESRCVVNYDAVINNVCLEEAVAELEAFIYSGNIPQYKFYATSFQQYMQKLVDNLKKEMMP